MKKIKNCGLKNYNEDCTYLLNNFSDKIIYQMSNDSVKSGLENDGMGKVHYSFVPETYKFPGGGII